jgi:exo-1,4-beta-D-glucosaminidase
MFEAFAINRSTGIGVIQWMLNAAWPKLYWQLYDYYLMPNAAFYGTLKACKSTNILYNYGNNAVYVSNDYDYSNQKLSAEIKLYDIHSKLILNETIEVSVGEYAAIKIFDLPEIATVSDVAFLDLNLKAANGKLITNNFYWLSAKADVQDNEKATWVYTPNKEFADFKALQTMPKANISSTQSITLADGKIEILLTIKNTTNKIAFFIEATAFDKTSGNEILPIFWDDNYISLLPNEQKTLKATINANNINTNNIELKLNGFNIE